MKFSKRILKSGQERGNCNPIPPPPPPTSRGSYLVAPTQYDDKIERLQLNENYPHPQES